MFNINFFEEITRKNSIYFINICAFCHAFLIFDPEKGANCENLRISHPLCGGKMLAATASECIGGACRRAGKASYGVDGANVLQAAVSLLLWGGCSTAGAIK